MKLIYSIITLLLMIGSFNANSESILTINEPAKIQKAEVVDKKEERSTVVLKPVINEIENKKEKGINENEFKQPWWLPHLFTILGFIVAALIVIFQLNKQHKSSMEVQNKNKVEELKLQIYHDFDEKLNNLSDASIKAGNYLNQLPENLALYHKQVYNNEVPIDIKQRPDEFLLVLNYLLSKILQVILLIEKYEVVEPRLKIFQSAFNSVHHNLMEFYKDLFLALIAVLPKNVKPEDIDKFGCSVISPLAISSDDFVILKQLCSKFSNAVSEVGEYQYDLRVESQNLFLGDLFGNTVPSREPIDPKCKVVKITEPEYTRVKNYFDHDSAWGKNCDEVDKQVNESFNESKVTERCT
ncbi:hypothetical protein [Shewanella sp. GutDb-MelDb]|uniref:hypothetical protein n=1 Tax=Shewanella sp. GutDb-MelDb TaxID=2058316 RepID=UPI000C79FF99|nr:hypothetical protein [Shewanella sp. GutDb-MelDb]PKG59209.1 hypothetical protein CXF82_00440 [Shewanella sp. GutDb-MelDb]